MVSESFSQQVPLLFRAEISLILPTHTHVILDIVNRYSEEAIFDPVMLGVYNGRYIVTDGHHRIVANFLRSINFVMAVEDELDDLSFISVGWCRKNGVTCIEELAENTVSCEKFTREVSGWCKKISEGYFSSLEISNLLNLGKSDSKATPAPPSGSEVCSSSRRSPRGRSPVRGCNR